MTGPTVTNHSPHSDPAATGRDVEGYSSPNSRASGILLHPTSLPSPHGIGDLGPEAYRFIDFLSHSGQSLWQILPLNPPGHGSSPYAALSASAGNPLLISLHKLADDGLIGSNDLETSAFPEDKVDFDTVQRFKVARFRRAYERFKVAGPSAIREHFEEFCAQESAWLADFALFMALRHQHHHAPWFEWETDLASRQDAAVAHARADLADEIEYQSFLQFNFFRQWSELRQYANVRAVRIVGDLPIFVAHDAADVWTNPHLFHLDDRGRPTVVAGVPPDAFSRTGQRWGNPLYRWETLAANGYGWWIERVRGTIALVDAIRMDHFRGFQAYWEVPAANPTAEHGQWIPGPGAALFAALENALGRLPIIVEDLGLITPDVEELRRQLGYPGMKVLQFAFGGDSANPYLPHNYVRHCVVYTATHDNDTTVGWFEQLSAAERNAVRRYLGANSRHIAWQMIRLALSSVADTAIIPMQDVLELGGEGRMNYPGHAQGNWAWRCAPDYDAEPRLGRLRELTSIYGRLPASRLR